MARMETALAQVTSVKPRQRRWVIVLMIGGFLSGWWFLSQRLNSSEQRLIGEWLSINHYEGATCARNWTFRGDRTCRIVNIYRYVATPTRGAYRDVDETNATWSLKDGQLIVDPERALTKRLNFQGMKVFHAIRNGLLGTNQRVFDGEASVGRVSLTSEQSFTVTWCDPSTGSDRGTLEWTRRQSADLVEPPTPE